MKKIKTLLMSLLMIFSLSSCGQNNLTDEEFNERISEASCTKIIKKFTTERVILMDNTYTLSKTIGNVDDHEITTYTTTATVKHHSTDLQEYLESYSNSTIKKDWDATTIGWYPVDLSVSNYTLYDMERADEVTNVSTFMDKYLKVAFYTNNWSTYNVVSLDSNNIVAKTQVMVSNLETDTQVMYTVVTYEY